MYYLIEFKNLNKSDSDFVEKAKSIMIKKIIGIPHQCRSEVYGALKMMRPYKNYKFAQYNIRI